MNNIQIHVMSHYNNLSKAEQKVADYFLANSEHIYTYPIAELAKASGVSSGTWVRFCKSIGYSGLKELKLALFNNVSEDKSYESTDKSLVFTDIKEHKSTEHIVESVEASSIKAIQNTFEILNLEALEEAAELIFEAKSVRIFGVGASALVAFDLAHKLLRIGINAIFVSDVHVQLTIAATTLPEDLAIIISNSGSTKEILEIQEHIVANKAKNIVITSIGRSPITSNSDILLNTSSPEIHLRSGAMSSRIAQLVLVDALFTTISNKNYSNIKDLLEQSYEVSLPHRALVKKNDKEK